MNVKQTNAFHAVESTRHAQVQAAGYKARDSCSNFGFVQDVERGGSPGTCCTLLSGTVCPGSLAPIYAVTSNIKWVITYIL